MDVTASVEGHVGGGQARPGGRPREEQGERGVRTGAEKAAGDGPLHISGSRTPARGSCLRSVRGRRGGRGGTVGVHRHAAAGRSDNS